MPQLLPEFWVAALSAAPEANSTGACVVNIVILEYSLSQGMGMLQAEEGGEGAAEGGLRGCPGQGGQEEEEKVSPS